MFIYWLPLVESVKKPDENITVKLKKTTHKRLLKRGTVGDTLDSVIVELLDIADSKNK